MSNSAQAIAYLELPVAASTTITAEDHVCYDSSGDIVVAADTSELVYAGQAAQTVVNSGAAGAVTVKVIPPVISPIHAFTASGASKSWYGKLVYFVNATTVALAATTTNDIPAGTCIFSQSATRVIVDTSKRA